MNEPTSTEPPFSAPVIAAIEQGRKIEAIKLLREESGLGLKEAKEAVEAYAERHPGAAGTRVGPRSDSSIGRFVVAGVVVAAAIAIYRYFF